MKEKREEEERRFGQLKSKKGITHRRQPSVRGRLEERGGS